MGFLEKIENFINLILIKLGELILKAVPRPVKAVFAKIGEWIQFCIQNFKRLPSIAKTFALALFAKSKSSALAYDYKGALLDTYKKAMDQYKEKSPKGMSTIKTVFLAPFLMVGQWLQGLSAAQAMLLLTFTGASFLAVIGIGFSGQKLANSGSISDRAPASTEETIEYERPAYYKKQTKFFEVTNLRLPVYFAKVNEVRSVDIDFTATCSNRNTRQFLEKHEFHLRDHLILQIEPSVASFPIVEEGKEIIRRKIMDEINDFLKLNEIEGEVTELKITYVLAN